MTMKTVTQAVAATRVAVPVIPGGRKKEGAPSRFLLQWTEVPALAWRIAFFKGWASKQGHRVHCSVGAFRKGPLLTEVVSFSHKRFLFLVRHRSKKKKKKTGGED